MFGAIYTHYHNYFTRGMKGAVRDSIDPIRWLRKMKIRTNENPHPDVAAVATSGWGTSGFFETLKLS